MPSKNSVKQYEAGAYYHIYNRGVEKRLVFMYDRDYQAFLACLKRYLLPAEPWSKPHKDLSEQIELVAYCLMPNHFHLLVRQVEPRAIESLMRCVMTVYVRHFNDRHGRVGSLFQDSYKAVRIRNEGHLYQAEQYIHQNPKDLVKQVSEYPYSSLFWRGKRPVWLRDQ
jgi:putative transposase